jgi:hypothetical protein
LDRVDGDLIKGWLGQVEQRLASSQWFYQVMISECGVFGSDEYSDLGSSKRHQAP